MLCHQVHEHALILLVDGVEVKFSRAREGAKVTMHTLEILLEPHVDSWENMATSQIRAASLVKEIFLLTSSSSFQRRTWFHGGNECFRTTLMLCSWMTNRFQITMLSIHR